MLDALRGKNDFYTRKLAGIDFDPTRDPMARLPLTTRAEIESDQIDHPPYGTNLTVALDQYTRFHQTSGSTRGTPLRWLDTAESWEWWKRCWGVIFEAAAVTSTDRIVFPFSFGPFIGFWAAFEAAVARGCLALPAGGMTTTARLRLVIENCATLVCCTPTYALHLAETAARDGIDLAGSSVRALIVAGEPGGSVPATRQRIEQAWGARVYDHAGMTEIGAWGVEFEDVPGSLFVLESEFIPEVLDPDTGQPTPADAIGELVLTNLGRWGSPLIRYRTGDLIRWTRDAAVPAAAGAHRSRAARGWLRAVGGVLGRCDDMLTIRGNNVFPSAIDGILRECDGLAEYQLRVRGAGALVELVVEVEPAPQHDAAALVQQAQERLRSRLHFRPVVRAAAVGSLPRFELKARRVVRE